MTVEPFSASRIPRLLMCFVQLREPPKGAEPQPSCLGSALPVQPGRRREEQHRAAPSTALLPASPAASSPVPQAAPALSMSSASRHPGRSQPRVRRVICPQYPHAPPQQDQLCLSADSSWGTVSCGTGRQQGWGRCQAQAQLCQPGTAIAAGEGQRAGKVQEHLVQDMLETEVTTMA